MPFMQTACLLLFVAACLLLLVCCCVFVAACLLLCCRRNTVPVAVRGLRLMVEEWIPGRSDSFNHTVTCHRMDCRTAIIHLAVPFYEKGCGEAGANKEKRMQQH